MADQHDDLHAEQTEGFKVGEKKTLDEYQNLGKQLHPHHQTSMGAFHHSIADSARQTGTMKP